MMVNGDKYNEVIRGGGVNSSSQRIIGLDLLRIALAILIYMFHSWMHFGCSYSLLTDFVSVGAIAMTGFFLLSGYSLRMVYGEQDLMEKHNLGRFYVKRMLGVLPLYYTVAILYIWLLGTETFSENMWLLPVEALGLQSTFSSLFGVTHNSGTWFISCILLAYLIYPFLQTVTKQMGLKFKVVLLSLLIFIDVIAAVETHKFDITWIYDNPFYRIIEFTSGLLIADINLQYDNRYLSIVRSKWMLLLSMMGLVIGVSAIRHYLHWGDYMLYNAVVLPCSTVVLFSLGSLRMPLLENSKAIGYFGKLSYAFFLTQFFSWKISSKIIDVVGYDSNWVRIILSFMICLVLAVAMYEIVQRPIVKVVKRRII